MNSPAGMFAVLRARAAVLRTLVEGQDQFDALGNEGADPDLLIQGYAEFSYHIWAAAGRLSEAFAEIEDMGIMDALIPAVVALPRVEIVTGAGE